jgi:hypothetical protein
MSRSDTSQQVANAAPAVAQRPLTKKCVLSLLASRQGSLCQNAQKQDIQEKHEPLLKTNNESMNAEFVDLLTTFFERKMNIILY